MSHYYATYVGILLRLNQVEITVKSRTRKGIRLGLVAGLVVTGLVGVTSLTASGTASTVPYGTLTLRLTDRAGSLTLVLAGGATFTQALGVATPCSTLVAGAIVDGSGIPQASSLLSFSAAVSGGSSPNVQLPSNGIGVTDGANCGGPSGLVGPGETLTLALGGFLPSNVTISTGTLQIGKSGGNDGNLRVAYDNGSFPTTATTVPVGVQPVPVADADGQFRSISIRSTATQSSRGLSLRTNTVFNLVTSAPATVPGAPTAVTAASGNAQATVEWVAPASDGGSPITSYELRYSPNIPVPTWTAPTTATTPQTVNGLTNGTEYIFEVRAVNTVGASAWTQSNAVTPVTVPDAPTAVTAASGNAQATVEWVAPASDGGSPITSYELRYSPNIPVPTWTAPTTATTPQTVNGLTNGTEYIFEVRAVNTVGASAWTQSNAVTPVTVPDAPTAVTAASGNAQATVEWVAPASDGGSPITSYELRYSPNIPVPTWTAPTTATTPQTVNGLTNGTEYIFEVRAVNTVGASAWTQSNAVTPWTELVDCGDEVIADGGPGAIAETAAFLRGENGAKTTTTCEDVGVVVEIVGNDWVYWDNSSVGVNGNPQAVQGTVTIDWAPIPVAEADTPTEIDYDGSGGPAVFVDRLWCASFSIVRDEIVGGKRVVEFDAQLPEFSGPGSVNGKAPWCLVSSSQSLDGEGNVNRTEIFFGAGDPLTRTIR